MFFFAHGDPFSGKAACVYLLVVLHTCIGILPLIVLLETDVLFSPSALLFRLLGAANHFHIFGSIVLVSVVLRNARTRVANLFTRRYKEPPPPWEPPRLLFTERQAQMMRIIRIHYARAWLCCCVSQQSIAGKKKKRREMHVLLISYQTADSRILSTTTM